MCLGSQAAPAIRPARTPPPLFALRCTWRPPPRLLFLRMPPICALCLGSTSDVPPFGTLHDARDLVAPCATCSFVAHRKCVFDWFNSVPLAKISRSTDFAPADFAPTNFAPPARAFDWLAPPPPHVLLLTPCPQCKQPVVFRTRPLAALMAAGLARATATDLVQYTGALLGVTGAASGVVTVVYVALARCGAAMLDALVPRALLGALLRRAPALAAAASKHHLVVLFPVLLYRARTAPGGTLTSLLLEAWICNYLLALGGHRLLRTAGAAIARAAHSAGLSLGALRPDHWLGALRPDHWLGALRPDHWLGAHRPGLSLRPLRPAHWAAAHPLDLVAAMVPVRWLYMAVFRATLNRWYFDLTVAARPRDIANSLLEPAVELLQDLSAAHAHARSRVARAWHGRAPGARGVAAAVRRIVRDRLLWHYVCTGARLHAHKTRACLFHDYSSTFVAPLAVVSAVTTLAWPFAAADVGRVVYRLVLARRANVPNDNLVFLLNLAGMVLVAAAHDVAAYYLSSRKAHQLASMELVYPSKPASAPAPGSMSASAAAPGSMSASEFMSASESMSAFESRPAPESMPGALP